MAQGPMARAGAGFHTKACPLILLADLLGKITVLRDSCLKQAWLSAICSEMQGGESVLQGSEDSCDTSGAGLCFFALCWPLDERVALQDCC